MSSVIFNITRRCLYSCAIMPAGHSYTHLSNLQRKIFCGLITIWIIFKKVFEIPSKQVNKVRHKRILSLSIWMAAKGNQGKGRRLSDQVFACFI